MPVGGVFGHREGEADFIGGVAIVAAPSAQLLDRCELDGFGAADQRLGGGEDLDQTVRGEVAEVEVLCGEYIARIEGLVVARPHECEHSGDHGRGVCFACRGDGVDGRGHASIVSDTNTYSTTNVREWKDFDS